MASWSEMLEQIRGFDLERAMGLRPPNPDVALELDRQSMTLVRMKPKRRRKPLLESYKVQAVEESGVPATIFDQEVVAPARLSQQLRALYEAAGARPGPVSLVLPDNLAKISLLTLPERPASRKQLDELIRFKMRRAVPFRLHDAAMSYQILPGEGGGAAILVALVRRSLVQRYEQALEAIGARPGLIDLCTPSLMNLCRKELSAAATKGDSALLNCARNYFSLVIFRGERLIFFRCKTYSMRGEPAAELNGLLAREVDYSLSYYEEKLSGKGIGTLLVRSAEEPVERVAEKLHGLEVQTVRGIDPVSVVPAAEGRPVDTLIAQRLAPALGAVLGRG